MFNNAGGYRSGQPLNLNNNTNMFFNNNPFYNNIPMMPPNANVQQWLKESTNNVLINLVNNTKQLTPQQATIIADRIDRNMNQFVQYMANATNNFSNCHPNIVTQAIGQIVQYIYNEMCKEAQQNAMMNTVAMNNATLLSNAAGNFNINNSFGAPVNNNPLIINTSVGGGYSRSRNRKNRDKINEQIQNHANAIAAPMKTDNNQQVTGVNTIDPTKHVKTNVKKSELNIVDNSYESPIQLKHVPIKTFNPDDKTSWPVELIDKYMSIASLNASDALKNYLSKCAINETYWKSKGVQWYLDDSFEISNIVKEKYEERKNLPKTDIKSDILHDGYEVKIQDDTFMNCKTDSVSTITLVYEGDVLSRSSIVFAKLDKEDIVPNEVSFINECTNGQLTDVKLVKSGFPTIDITAAQNMAFVVNYDVSQVIDVPYKVFEEPYKQLCGVCNKYSKMYNQKFREFITEFIDCLYNMPRKWSERVDKFVTDILNESADRNMKNMTRGLAHAPHFNSFINIKDIIEGREYNLLAKESSFDKYFAVLIYNTLASIFNGVLLNPEVESDIDSIVDTIHGKELLIKYHGSDVASSDIASWKSDNDTFTNKINQLKKHLNHYSTITVNKNLLITDVVPNIKYVNNINVWCMYPPDNHLDAFEMMIIQTFNYGNCINDAVIIDGTDKTMFPGAYFKLGSVFDRYIGRMKVEY